MFFIGFYVRFNPPIKGQPIPPVGYAAISCIFLFAAFFQFGWGPCCWIIVSEIPTARLRAMNVALAAATQWLFNFVVAQAVPHMMATVGSHGYGTYFIFGSFCFSMFFFVWFLIPETKGMSLEKMDDMCVSIHRPLQLITNETSLQLWSHGTRQNPWRRRARDNNRI